MVKENTMRQTEIGLLPEDWEVVRIIEVANKVTDGTHDTPKQVGKGVPYLTAIHIKSNWIDYKGAYFLPELVHRQIFARCNPEKGDVLMVNIGAGAGNCALNIVDYEFSLKNVALIKPDNKKANGSFLNQWQNYNRENILNTIITGGAQPFLSLNQISNLQIPLPPFPEQEAIAEALSDADAWIESLEQLIAKKRLIKEGAMQELLSPKEDWEVKKLGEICEIFKGKGISKGQLKIDGAFECILYGELFTKYGEVISSIQSRTNVSNSIFSKIGDVLFPGSTTTTGIDLAKASALLKDNVLLGGDIIILRKSKYDYNSIFLSYFLNEKRKFEIAQTTKGITIHHLYGNDLAGIYVEFPTLTDQTRIATILSDMDVELEALEGQLGKARKIKQGMMQELLTGSVRLV